MAIVRTLIILALVGLILGGSAFFAYELYWKPRKLDQEDAAASLKAPVVVDYTLPAFEKAVGIQRSGDVDGARAAWAEFIRNYPNSPRIAEAKATLGQINTGQVFSPAPSPEKTLYSVSKGDSLVKIASKFKSDAELIFRVNNLQTINLKIGQQLAIPQLAISIVVDRKARTVTLLNKGEFFKEYHAVALKAPGTSTVQTKVTDKVAMLDTKRVAFGDKNYSGSERSIMLSSAGHVIRGLVEGATPPPGIIVAQPDIEEIFLLVSRGTPVTIQ
ncbi:MAG TPA: LysM peptidoglycan-binding domain-containing protein [Terrimicrobiaceae bacterium]